MWLKKMSQALKEWAFASMPLNNEALALDPEYDSWLRQLELKSEQENMKMNDMYPSSSSFLKADDLKGKKIKLTIDSVRMEQMDDRMKPVVSFKGTDRELVLNKTNGTTIAAMYGDDTDDWTGKEIKLYPTIVDFGGKSVPAIRVEEQVEEAMSDEIPF